jgi:tRNA(fMet)-specific endonuclease VapC
LKKYLLDTDICIYFLKTLFDIDKKIESAGVENCFVSEITIAELKYGVENSHQIKNRETLEKFQDKFTILPIFTALDIFAREKSRLRKKGKLIDDFDMLIGATAISNNLILVTRNTDHFGRLERIDIEEWI